MLLDGERLANNAFTGTVVDLGGVPFSAIDSVQVLRAKAASALYGSDAIAGVINFITKKNYQGYSKSRPISTTRGKSAALRVKRISHLDTEIWQPTGITS